MGTTLLVLVFLTFLHLGLSLTCYKCEKDSCDKKDNWIKTDACDQSVLLSNPGSIENPVPTLNPIFNPASAFDRQNTQSKIEACVSASYSDDYSKHNTVKACIMVNKNDLFNNPTELCDAYLNQHIQSKPSFHNDAKCNFCTDNLCNYANSLNSSLVLPFAFLFFFVTSLFI